MPDTGDFGEESRRFPSTVWGQFLGSRSRESLAHLAERYWKPICAFIRMRWAKSPEEAADLTQEFFVWILESDFVGKADPCRGRFRGYVKASLQNFLSNAARDRGRLKRGGGRKVFTFGDAPPEMADPSATTPEEALDEAWRDEMLLRARERLEADLKADGKAAYAGVFRDYYLSESDLDYRTVAARYGITETEVSNYLMHAKRRFRAILSDLVAETVEGPGELREELRALFGGAIE